MNTAVTNMSFCGIVSDSIIVLSDNDDNSFFICDVDWSSDPSNLQMK